MTVSDFWDQFVQHITTMYPDASVDVAEALDGPENIVITIERESFPGIHLTAVGSSRRSTIDVGRYTFSNFHPDWLDELIGSLYSRSFTVEVRRFMFTRYLVLNVFLSDLTMSAGAPYIKNSLDQWEIEGGVKRLT